MKAWENDVMLLSTNIVLMWVTWRMRNVGIDGVNAILLLCHG